MRYLILITIVIIAATACRKIKCGDNPINLELQVDKKDSFLLYTATKLSKGGATEINTTVDTAYSPYQVILTKDELINYDWKIKINATEKMYSITDVRYEKKKGPTEYGISSDHPHQCSNDVYYTINGVQTRDAGKEWNRGLQKEGMTVITITK